MQALGRRQVLAPNTISIRLTLTTISRIIMHYPSWRPHQGCQVHGGNDDTARASAQEDIIYSCLKSTNNSNTILTAIITTITVITVIPIVRVIVNNQNNQNDDHKIRNCKYTWIHP